MRPRCPRCGHGALYDGMLKIADGCTHCGLSYEGQDAADGPAFFVITVMGFLITGLAAVVEFRYSPPLWVHALIWLPLIFILCIAGLRLCKSVLIAIQYRLHGLQHIHPQ